MRNLRTPLALTVLITSGALLAGCASGVSSKWENFPNKTVLSPLRLDDTVDRDDAAKAKSLAREDFSFEMVRFHDRRTPQERSATVDGTVIYEYMPDKILRGVESYMGSSLKRFLTFGPRQETVFKMEYELRRLRTYIANGGFVSGVFGIYRAELEADLIVRDKNSRVIYRDTVSLDAYKNRNSNAGRNPSAQADAQNIDRLVRRLVRKLAIESAWKVRGVVGKGKDLDSSTTDSRWGSALDEF